MAADSDLGFCPSCCKPCGRDSCERCGYECDEFGHMLTLDEIIKHRRPRHEWRDVDLSAFARAVIRYDRRKRAD